MWFPWGNGQVKEEILEVTKLFYIPRSKIYMIARCSVMQTDVHGPVKGTSLVEIFLCKACEHRFLFRGCAFIINSGNVAQRHVYGL